VPKSRKEIKAVGLLSSGLDSTLALTHMHRLGYDVAVYHFANGVHADLHTGRGKPMALATAERLGVPVEVIDNSAELLQVVKHPEHGYGKNMNPCIDCRILMFRMAFARMKAEGGRFLFTGEVVGQRPMSQRRHAMELIDRAAGVEGIVVRPLCGKLLPPTIPEREGWVSRDDLMDLSGRSRKPQMALARQWGIGEYESPAGGCLLTDPGYALRLRDALRFGDPDVREMQLLKAGRHFRLSPESRAILGRNAEDCRVLGELLQTDEITIEARDMAGPLATIRGAVTPETIRMTAALVLRYAKADAGNKHAVTVRRGDESEEIGLVPATEDEARGALIAAEGGCGGQEYTR
jgi:tRNA-uridine 2-sulfurtransferase